MLSLDDCNRQELKRLARYATPAQIAEAKARIAREAAGRENEDRLAAARDSVDAARRVRAHFEAHGADEDYRLLFALALAASRRSQHAQGRWARLEVAACKLERVARREKAKEQACRPM